MSSTRYDYVLKALRLAEETLFEKDIARRDEIRRTLEHIRQAEMEIDFLHKEDLRSEPFLRNSI